MSKRKTEQKKQTQAEQDKEEAVHGGQAAETGEKIYTQAEAQHMIDRAMANRFKEMPTAEEMQKSMADAQQTRQRYEGRLAALSAGVRADCVDDALALAAARVDQGAALDDALCALVAEHPTLGRADALPGRGANPPKQQKQRYKPPVVI